MVAYALIRRTEDAKIKNEICEFISGTEINENNFPFRRDFVIYYYITIYYI